MSERSYIRQQPLWLQLLKIRRERAAWEAKARERNEFNSLGASALSDMNNRLAVGSGVSQ